MAQKRNSKPVTVYLVPRDFARLALLKESAAKVAETTGESAPTNSSVIREAIEKMTQIAGMTDADINAKVAELAERKKQG